MKIVIPVILFSPLLFINACNSSEQDQGNIDKGRLKEELIKANKVFVEEESEDIDAYIERAGYKMQVTETGLRYMFLKKSGSGTKPKVEQTVSVHISLDLLDGTHCYDSDSLGAIVFTVGKAEVPRGLEEGVQLMELNDEAIFILPAHLGFGLTGDGSKVPPNRALKYRVRLLSVNK